MLWPPRGQPLTAQNVCQFLGRSGSGPSQRPKSTSWTKKLSLGGTKLIPIKTTPKRRCKQEKLPVSTNKKTPEWLAANIANFRDKSLRLPSRPDLNPLEFSVLGVLKFKACETSHARINTLKLSNVQVWRAIKKAFIIKMCYQFWPCPEKVIDLEGCFFKE